MLDMMSRRSFLSIFTAGVAAAALLPEMPLDLITTSAPLANTLGVFAQDEHGNRYVLCRAADDILAGSICSVAPGWLTRPATPDEVLLGQLLGVAVSDVKRGVVHPLCVYGKVSVRVAYE